MYPRLLEDVGPMSSILGIGFYRFGINAFVASPAIEEYTR